MGRVKNGLQLARLVHPLRQAVDHALLRPTSFRTRFLGINRVWPIEYEYSLTHESQMRRSFLT